MRRLNTSLTDRNVLRSRLRLLNCGFTFWNLYIAHPSLFEQECDSKTDPRLSFGARHHVPGAVQSPAQEPDTKWIAKVEHRNLLLCPAETYGAHQAKTTRQPQRFLRSTT